MKPAALGFRVHSGWVALVAISLEDGFPMVLSRQRPHLVKVFTFDFRQPYHTAQKKPLGEARDFIAQVRAEARGLADGVIHAVQTNLREQGYEVRSGGLLLASGKPLPALPGILASHALIHTADGELFREAVLHACKKKNGLAVLAVKEKELLERASRALRMSAEELAARVAEAGRGHGTPWAQDEKFATLVACLSMLETGQPESVSSDLPAGRPVQLSTNAIAKPS